MSCEVDEQGELPMELLTAKDDILWYFFEYIASSDKWFIFLHSSPSCSTLALLSFHDSFYVILLLLPPRSFALCASMDSWRAVAVIAD